MSIFYGPVLSRRFGYSLGVDIIPYKICSYDCVFCQLGKTTCKTTERKKYVNINKDDFVESLKKIISSGRKINYVTFSGSGEPTLNSEIKMLINLTKATTNIPVAVLTNGSLLYRKEVVESIKKADLLKISFDGPTDSIFRKINRPHRNISFNNILEGLKSVIQNYSNYIFIEIMLVKGINDSIKTAEQFKYALGNIFGEDINKVKKIHLNTPVRPPGVKNILPPDIERILEIKKVLGEKADLIEDIKAKPEEKISGSLSQDIIELVKRRPVNIRDISSSLEVNINEVIKCVRELLERNKIKYRLHHNEKYYYC